MTQRQQIVLELGGIFLAANRACRGPQHLLHALVAEYRAFLNAPPASKHRLAVEQENGLRSACEPRLSGELADSVGLQFLRFRFSAFPPVNRGERDVQFRCKLLLTQV
jgi:hypothetical protein